MKGLTVHAYQLMYTLRTDNVDRPRARVVRPQTSTAESNAEVWCLLPRDRCGDRS